MSAASETESVGEGCSNDSARKEPPKKKTKQSLLSFGSFGFVRSTNTSSVTVKASDVQLNPSSTVVIEVSEDVPLSDVQEHEEPVLPEKNIYNETTTVYSPCPPLVANNSRRVLLFHLPRHSYDGARALDNSANKEGEQQEIVLQS